MSNLDKMKSMDNEELTSFIEKNMRSVFHKYIDYAAFLQSDDEDIMHFLIPKEQIILGPTQAELVSALGLAASDEEKARYIESHKKVMIKLEDCSMFGHPYVAVADMENKSYAKYPADCIISSKET